MHERHLNKIKSSNCMIVEEEESSEHERFLKLDLNGFVFILITYYTTYYSTYILSQYCISLSSQEAVSILFTLLGLVKKIQAKTNMKSKKMKTHTK